MIARLFALGWLCAAVVIAEDAPRAIQVTEAPEQPAPAGTERVVSRTRQFRVTGGDSLVRGSVALLAEEAKDELLELIGESPARSSKDQAPPASDAQPNPGGLDDWKVPVTILLHGKEGDPLPARTLSMRLLVTAGVSELRLDVHLSHGIEQENFKRAVTTALLYERALRNRPADESDRPLDVPPWLADGLREATAWRLNQSDRHLYETLFKHGGLFKIDELFTIGDNAFEDMDAAMRAAFRVSSGAMVMALLEQPQGKEGFRAFLTEVASYEGEMPGLLRKHFPELNLSETSLAKWWALQFASKGGLNLLTDILTIQQTEAALADALHLQFRTAEGIVQQKELTAWPELATLKEPDRRAAVQHAQDALVRLSYRCFPSYRPLLVDYQAVLGALAKNKTKETAKQLAALGETRATMLAKAKRARDYLDWFEITRARETSGAFDDYLRLKERLKANPHHRKDNLSDYLDRMDRIFSRDEPKGGAPTDLPPGLPE
jgi:hypothetical protein